MAVLGPLCIEARTGFDILTQDGVHPGLPACTGRPEIIKYFRTVSNGYKLLLMGKLGPPT